MNFFKRALISITKRKVKSLILILVLGVVANMVLAGLSIQTATEKAGELARQKLGGNVKLEVDYEKAMSKVEKGSNGTIGKPTFQVLTVDIAENLKSLKHLKAYNYISTGYGVAENFKAVKVESDNNKNGGVQMSHAIGTGPQEKLTPPNISLSGTLYTELLSDFTDGKSEIIEGRHLNEEDSNKNVAIIEKKLMEENNLKLGDMINIKSTNGKKETKLEIIGVFENKINDANNFGGLEIFSPNNKIYVPTGRASELKEEFMGENTPDTIDSAVYFLDDPQNIEEFKNEAKTKDINFDNYRLDANDAMYKQMMGPIENVASFSKTIVLLVTVAGSVILALIIMLSLKDRKYELGVLLSLGESRMKIIGQLIVETALIACVAFGISTFTGKISAQNIGDNLLKNELKVAEEQQKEGAPGGVMVAVSQSGIINSQDTKPIEEMDVSVTSKDIQRLSIIGIIIVFISTIFPVISTLRFNPKTILVKTE